MNNKQRMVLITGAIVFLYVLLTSPRISIVKGTYMIPPPDKKEVARIVDINTAVTRAAAVLGATVLVFVALKARKGTQRESPKDRKPDLIGHGKGDERQLTGENLFARIIRFLKDFF